MRAFPFGKRLDSNDEPLATLVGINKAHQRKHIGLFGRTGHGKSVLLIRGILGNYFRTAGADIILDQKGDGFPQAYLKAHYAATGTLQNVYEFDLEAVVPALSVLDVRPLVAAGVPRQAAVNRIADQYLEIARAVVGPEQFDQSARAANGIKHLLKALFDPVYGDDAVSHQQLRAAARRYTESGEVPQTSQPDLQESLAEMQATPTDMRMGIGDAMTARLSEVAERPQLRELLNAPADPDAETATFDFRALLDQSAIIILDLSGLAERTRHAVANLLLAQLWRALKRRTRSTPAEHPLVNIYLDEARAFKHSETIAELLSQGRSFDVSLLLSAQSPSQLATDAATDNQTELLENAHTIIASGSVDADDYLSKRLAGAQLDQSTVTAILSSLAAGEWLVSLPAGYRDRQPNSFVAVSAPAPPGHPDSDYPLAESRLADAFTEARTHRRQAVADAYGRRLEGSAAPTAPAATDADDDNAGTQALQRNSLLPVTTRLPETVAYDHDHDCLRCTACETEITYAPTQAGLMNAATCCLSRDAIDRDNIPPVACHVTRSQDALDDAALSARQALFMQAVHNATHQQHPDIGYRLLEDSMVRLREYTGIETAAVDALIDRELLTCDTDNTPHRIYSLTQDGRDALGITQLTGREHGDGIGDLGESALHRLCVAAGRKYIATEFVADDTHPAVAAEAYVPCGDGQRLDAAGLDADGTIVVTLEAERANNDAATAVPSDFDKMAACNPTDAIWIVENRDGGNAVLDALYDPADGDPRITQTYGNTAPRDFNIDTDGFTQALTITYCLRHLDL